MKKRIFVDELTPGEPVQGLFLAVDAGLRTSRDGEPFLQLKLRDRTGEVTARAWNDPEMLAGRVAAQDFVALRGEVKTFQKDVYVEIADIDRVDDAEIDFADFFDVSRWDGAELMEQLDLLVDSVTHNGVRRFLVAALAEPTVRERLPHAPAAMRNHHAFRGGLVEHILSMCRLAETIGRHYAGTYPGLLDTDLVVAGCVLHDLAKVWELNWRRSTEYTDSGRLVGHIPMGVQYVRRVADEMQPPLAEDLVLRLEHLVASHHGQLEYGSPVVPKTPEALVLHHVDMIDSRLNMCWNEVTSAWEDGERWTGYSRALGGRFFAGDAPDRPDATLPAGPGLSLDRQPTDPDVAPNLDLFEG